MGPGSTTIQQSGRFSMSRLFYELVEKDLDRGISRNPRVQALNLGMTSGGQQITMTKSSGLIIARNTGHFSRTAMYKIGQS